MADDESEGFIDQMAREVLLNLSVKGGRVFVHNADTNNLNRCTIELKCSWSPVSIFEESVWVGEDRHKPLTWDDDGVEMFDEDATEADERVGWSLYDCPIMLSVYEVDENWLADSATKNEGQAILGRLDYNAPMQTSDGVVNKTRPSINAWVGFGPENFRLIRDRVVASDVPDFDLGLTVEFPRGSVESGWVKRVVKWDGNGSLAVINATLVWLRADWDSDNPRTRPMYREPDYVQPREHGEVLQAVTKLEAAVARLATPLWIAVGAAIVAAWVAR